MTEKKRSSKTSKLKNFLVTGSIEDGEEQCDMAGYEEPPDNRTESGDPYSEGTPEEEEEVIIKDIAEEIEIVRQEEADADRRTPHPVTDTGSLEKEILLLKEMVTGLTSELERYTTSKEQLKEYSSIMNKRDAELANRKFIGMLEQLSVMREDFFKLCSGMNAKLGSFSPTDILNSFEAYGVDMENILADCGVQIGPSKFERLNTMHQRIVDVIPTGDESMNGMIAERVSDGYEYQGRVLLKERVKIYRFSEERRTEGDEEK